MLSPMPCGTSKMKYKYMANWWLVHTYTHKQTDKHTDRHSWLCLCVCNFDVSLSNLKSPNRLQDADILTVFFDQPSQNTCTIEPAQTLDAKHLWIPLVQYLTIYHLRHRYVRTSSKLEGAIMNHKGCLHREKL